jgi:hypothetical protein
MSYEIGKWNLEIWTGRFGHLFGLGLNRLRNHFIDFRSLEHTSVGAFLWHGIRDWQRESRCVRELCDLKSSFLPVRLCPLWQ